jgi:hypothetical protein
VLCSSKTFFVENCSNSDICIQISNTMITPDPIIIEVAMFSDGTRKHGCLTTSSSSCCILMVSLDYTSDWRVHWAALFYIVLIGEKWHAILLIHSI